MLAVPPGYPPSTYAIDDLVRGRPGGLLRTVELTLLRAALVAPGLWIARVPPRRIVPTALTVSTVITLGLVLYKGAAGGN